MVVGADLENTLGPETGAAYVYDLDSAQPTEPVFTLNDPVVTTRFGNAVVLAGDRAVVGADWSQMGFGSAYLYDFASASPAVPVATLTNPAPVVSDLFCVDVALSEDYMIVGDNIGSAFVFDANASVEESAPTGLDLSNSSVAEDLPAGTTIGPYRLLREIGRGGMGVVFLAERTGGDFEQRVAVKVLKRSLAGEEILRRFRQERTILASLVHPNIARLYGGGTTEGGRRTPW